MTEEQTTYDAKREISLLSQRTLDLGMRMVDCERRLDSLQDAALPAVLESSQVLQELQRIATAIEELGCV